jgi:hypothetical protein
VYAEALVSWLRRKAHSDKTAKGNPMKGKYFIKGIRPPSAAYGRYSETLARVDTIEDIELMISKFEKMGLWLEIFTDDGQGNRVFPELDYQLGK